MALTDYIVELKGLLSRELCQQIQSPYLPIMNRQAVLMMKAASELGFNPTSRSKIVIPPEPRENSPWAQFIKP
jgi:phage terminase small subunit